MLVSSDNSHVFLPEHQFVIIRDRRSLCGMWTLIYKVAKWIRWNCRCDKIDIWTAKWESFRMWKWNFTGFDFFHKIDWRLSTQHLHSVGIFMVSRKMKCNKVYHLWNPFKQHNSRMYAFFSNNFKNQCLWVEGVINLIRDRVIHQKISCSASLHRIFSEKPSNRARQSVFSYLL